MRQPSCLRFDDENEDVGQEAAREAEQNAGTAVNTALYPRKKHHSRRDRPSESDPRSRAQQRRVIREQYAAMKAGRDADAARWTEEAAAKAREKATEAAKKTAAYIHRHKKAFLIVGALGLLLAFMLSVFSFCSVMVQGAGSAVASSTFPSADADMLGAEAAYCALEAELQDYLDTYRSTHGYDEYHFDLDSIEHDPYVLISILTALHGGAWTLDEARSDLRMLFDRQYTLTENVYTVPRVNENGERCDYTVCNVKLENFNLSHLPIYIMGEDQLSMYAAYMATLGNRTDLFPASGYISRYSAGITRYEIPPEALSDERFAAMIAEAEKYLGYPYVWGGSSPSTSFDCSGFVSWVINHSGWNVGRLGSDALYFSVCTPIPPSEARPGDLIFFQHTYNTPYTSHVGIYVGNGMMIHCGDPIQYTSINTNYWQQHFYGFGRLP